MNLKFERVESCCNSIVQMILGFFIRIGITLKYDNVFNCYFLFEHSIKLQGIFVLDQTIINGKLAYIVKEKLRVKEYLTYLVGLAVYICAFVYQVNEENFEITKSKLRLIALSVTLFCFVVLGGMCFPAAKSIQNAINQHNRIDELLKQLRIYPNYRLIMLPTFFFLFCVWSGILTEFLYCLTNVFYDHNLKPVAEFITFTMFLLMCSYWTFIFAGNYIVCAYRFFIVNRYLKERTFDGCTENLEEETVCDVEAADTNVCLYFNRPKNISIDIIVDFYLRQCLIIQEILNAFSWGLIVLYHVYCVSISLVLIFYFKYGVIVMSHLLLIIVGIVGFSGASISVQLAKDTVYKTLELLSVWHITFRYNKDIIQTINNLLVQTATINIDTTLYGIVPVDMRNILWICEFAIHVLVLMLQL